MLRGVGRHAPGIPTDVAGNERAGWALSERVVLCFVRNGGTLLLYPKQTELGAGRGNAPEARTDPGETAEEAAVYDAGEEVRVETSGLRRAGELIFRSLDGYVLHGTVVLASEHSGTPRETREADPFWCGIDEIPCERM